MELLFLWIEDFRNIQKQGFDFSSELKFSVTDLSQNKYKPNYQIDISINPAYVKLFDDSVIDVTGIVGKNGSGKSSLLHCLKMMSGDLTKLVCPLIFCLLDRKTKMLNTYYYKEGGLEEMLPLSVSVKGDSAVKSKYELTKPTPYSIIRHGIEGSKIKGLDFNFSSIACCYFSNTFDSHRENIYGGIENISTNYRVDAFLKKYIDDREKDARKGKAREVHKLELFPSHIHEYHKKELRTLLRFIAYANKRKQEMLPHLPHALHIEFNFEDYEILKDKSSDPFLFSTNQIKEIQEVGVKLVLQAPDKRDNFFNVILLSSFYYLLRKYEVEKDDEHIEELKSRIRDLAKTGPYFFENLKTIIDLLTRTGRDSAVKTAVHEFIGTKFSNSVKKLEFVDSDIAGGNKAYYRLKIDNNLWMLLGIIYDLQSLEESTFINYTWGGGLSTGQEAFLTHFARLFELKRKLGNKFIWLLIDEGDLYFHPDWQKQYLTQLLDYVNFIFPQNKVQIIITTHSPFIASDLPKQNLIFLKQGKQGLCEVADNEIHRETFGSNIHELFTESFFLEDGLMGEFARTKIADLIKEINDLDSISDELYREKFKNRIEIIGEHFLRAKLLELVASKSDDSTIDTIIEQRNNEIENLRKLKKEK